MTTEPGTVVGIKEMPGVDHNQVSASKRDWNSLPAEIKRKVIKFLPLRTRFTVMVVCKTFQEIVKQLNCLETKLVITDQDNLEPADDANSLCGLAHHTFDRSSVLDLFKDLKADEACQLASNFPNLIALQIQIESTEIIDALSRICRKLEHLSSSNEPSYGKHLKDFDLSKITCLGSGATAADLILFPNLKYCSQPILSKNVFSKLLSQGLVGYSMTHFADDDEFLSQCLPLIVNSLSTTEVLYDLNFIKVERNFLALLPRMTKLTTIYIDGDTEDVRAYLTNIKSLRNLNWIANTDDIEWDEFELHDTLQSFGHQLRSLRVAFPLHPEKAIKAVLSTCPNLEELSVKYQNMQSSPVRNSVREFQLILQFTKLKKCDIDGREVDLKLLRELKNISELEAMCLSEGPMTVKQMLRAQQDTICRQTVARKLQAKDLTIDAMAKEILELKAQLANNKK